jgi:hypothetical protein
LALLMAGGCASWTEVPLEVYLRDAKDGKPVSGATVMAEVPSRDHPFSIATMLGQTQPVTSRATTDSKGVARVKAIAERPVRLGFIGAGHAPGFVLLDPVPSGAAGAAAVWMPVTTDGSGGDALPGLEVRVEPGER